MPTSARAFAAQRGRAGKFDTHEVSALVCVPLGQQGFGFQSDAIGDKAGAANERRLSADAAGKSHSAHQKANAHEGCANVADVCGHNCLTPSGAFEILHVTTTCSDIVRKSAQM